MKSSNHKADISLDEIMATLTRSSLPTIVVEGADDMIVYRNFEENLSSIGVSVLPVGGRENVLEIYSRRDELPSSVKVSFIADQDVWVNTGIPAEYQNERLLFTNGYSIENDVYIDGELWKLLNTNEVPKFDADVREFLRWYALALSRHLLDKSETIKLHPDHVLNPTQQANLLSLRTDEIYPEELHEELVSNFRRLLRGKSLMALLVRHTNYKGREPRHNSKALMEVVAKRPGPLLDSLYTRVRSLYVEEGFMSA